MTEIQVFNPSLVPAASGRLLVGDSLSILSTLEPAQFRSCITSPPYWGLRDYGVEAQLGAEATLDEYIFRLVLIFREVRRVLTEDGTLWLNLGDSYTSGGRTRRAADKKNPARAMSYRAATPAGLKPKDLIGVPWKVAFALQADGWYLRADVIWHKPNAQPESVRDRPSHAHEYVFLFSKNEHYYYDREAMKEPAANGARRSRRTVWSINTEPFRGAHFATFPPALVEPCVDGSTTVGDDVIDPFFGSGTVGLVSLRKGRNFCGIEINPEYADIARERLNLGGRRG